MANVETKPAQKNRHGKRLTKKSTRVDLTPMVDLGFLLLSFFVFTTALSQPKVMGIVTPIESDNLTPVCESCALTAILGSGDRVFYYQGMQGNATTTKSTTFSPEGLRKLLTEKRENVKNVKGTADDMVLIVKPSDESNYRNFVDILDEVNINGIKHYLAHINYLGD
jgi:biopolymer transport protein ExbD